MARNKFTKTQLKWLEALESGDFRQISGVLKSMGKNGDATPRYCCLGVACEVLGVRQYRTTVEQLGKAHTLSLCGVFQKTGEDTGSLSVGAAKRLRLHSTVGSPIPAGALASEAEVAFRKKHMILALTDLNDVQKWSFKKIAKHLRTYPQYYFQNFDAPA